MGYEGVFLTMIYSQKFVWLHFPKCAGSKIEQLFKTYFSRQEDVFQDVIETEKDSTFSWHDSVADREARDPAFRLGDRMVICPFRKLPFWLESRYNFEAQRTPHLPHRPEWLLEGKFLEANGMENHADIYIQKYLPAPILNSSKLRFLRTEFFEHDFKSIFNDFLDLSRIPDWEYKSLVNFSEKSLPAQIKRTLFEDQKAVYEKCPAWRRVEEMAYGTQAGAV